MSRFTKKTAAVTGGASGIGLAIAQRLAEEAAEVTALPDATPHNLSTFQPGLS